MKRLWSQLGERGIIIHAAAQTPKQVAESSSLGVTALIFGQTKDALELERVGATIGTIGRFPYGTYS